MASRVAAPSLRYKVRCRRVKKSYRRKFGAQPGATHTNALHRVVQRDPTADLDAVIFEAHHASLTVRLPGSGEHSFLIPAGRGAFICSLTTGPDSSTGLSVCVSAHAWIHVDQLAADQHFAVPSNVPGERLGDALLLPLALHHLATVGA